LSWAWPRSSSGEALPLRMSAHRLLKNARSELCNEKISPFTAWH
jgi:hypothetical protein